MRLDYCIIDATAPFFLTGDSGAEVNWSKIRYEQLEADGAFTEERFVCIEEAFHRYIDAIIANGYNAITLDDMAHLVLHSFYPNDLTERITRYQSMFSRLISFAVSRGCKVFITTDIMFLSEAIEAHTRMDHKRMIGFLCRSLRRLYRDFPEIAGVVVRIGESDGIDVVGDFRSRMVIKSARQCRTYLKALLQVCESYEKLLVFRTWTLGAFPIGDLMWNPSTFHAIFDNLPVENLIISQKYGETDFFRYLTMSPLLFEGHHRRIVEFQARREYEGFGEFPSFVGFDYQRYSRYLSTLPTLCGISVWCQTGGWSHFDRLTFVRKSSLWVELNLYCIIRIFKDDVSAESAAETFITARYPGCDGVLFVRFLRLADKAIKELWYIPEFAVQRLYFRRTHVPPLFYLFWDSIMINHTIRKIIRRFVHERREAIQDGYRALYSVEKMKRFAEKLPIDISDIEFQYETFKVLALAREYYFGEWNPSVQERISEAVDEYRARYPQGFHCVVDFKPVKFRKWLIKVLFGLSLRRHPHYRIIDRLFMLRLTSLVYPLFRIWEKRRLPSFTRSQAMGIEVLFK